VAGAFLASVLLSGCALTQDSISLAYVPQTNAVPVAGASAVSVKVDITDSRSIKDRVGAKKNGFGMDMAAIISNDDVAETVKRAVHAELTDRGFKLADGDVLLLIDLNKFYNDFKVGFWAGDAVAEVTMQAEIKKSDGSIVYSKLITGEGKNTNIQLASGTNAKIALDAALADAIAKLFGDPQFIDSLLKASKH
jgi:uncharacterized lipoprotein